MRAVVGALLGLALAPATAGAAGILSWSFDPAVHFAESDASVEIEVRLSNVGDQTLSGIDLLIWFGDLGSIPDAYDFDTYDPAVIDALDLAPGEESTFVFMTLTPLGGSAGSGTWSLGGITLVFSIGGGPNSFVGGSGGPASVMITPEPAPLLLVAAGLVALAHRRSSPPR